MTKKEKEKQKAEEKTISYRGSEGMQFANSIEFAVKACSDKDVNSDLLWLMGWQLGQLRPLVRDYQDAMSSDRIKEMNRQLSAVPKDSPDYSSEIYGIETKFSDAIGMIDAANSKEHAVRVRVPSRELFSDGAPAAFIKVLSFMEID